MRLFFLGLFLFQRSSHIVGTQGPGAKSFCVFGVSAKGRTRRRRRKEEPCEEYLFGTSDSFLPLRTLNIPCIMGRKDTKLYPMHGVVGEEYLVVPSPSPSPLARGSAPGSSKVSCTVTLPFN